MVDAENFSVYTIVTQLAEEPIGNISTWIEWSNYERIVQQNPEDTTQCVIIMDRNLWATTNNTSSSNSYGYYYQWWNNYWFTSSSSSVSDDRPNVSSYWASAYKSSTLIKYYVQNGSFYNRTRDYNQQWMSSMNSNLWWWWSDNSSNSYGQGQTNYTDRQWPCPDGWHVPSAYEWSTLNRYWTASKWYTTASTNNVAWIQSENLAEFKSDFYIPNNGYLTYTYDNGFFSLWASESLGISNWWTYAYLYTSSPYNTNAAITMYSNWGFVSYTSNNTERAEWVRCFKDPVWYSIQFVNYDGTVLQSGMVMEWGTPVYNGDIPEKPSDSQYIYTFEWWDSEISMVVGTKTYTAVFERYDLSDAHRVTFETNGWNIIPEQIVWDWAKVIKPADPIKNNQIFKYWTTDSQWNNQYNFDTPVEWDLILYAQWANVCTVTFTNGYCYYGTNNTNNTRARCTFSELPMTVEVACGTPVRRPEDPNSPITVRIGNNNRSEYFSRWSNSEQPWPTNTSNNFDFSTSITQSKTIYAIWNNNYNTVTFNANGWILAGEWSTEVDANIWQYGSVREPDEPTKTWYLLKWWSRTQNNWSPYDFSSQVTSSFTLYAQWAPITYTIRYKANGWTWTMADTTMTYDTSDNLRMNTFTKDNASFSGWNTKADGSWIWYSNGHSVINWASTTWDMIKLYAIWKCNTGYREENGECVSDIQNCPLPANLWWGILLHGSGMTVYSTAGWECPTTCTAWTIICNNGILEWNTWYNYTGCNLAQLDCDASFTLNSTGANWTYDSCTPYTVNDNSCNAWTTVYKLTNCASGYHTEDNSICTWNIKTVACTQSWKPDHSSYVAWNVQITWQWTWNNGSWPTADDCAWTCDPYYHTWANNNSCEIDTFQITWLDWDGKPLGTDMVNYGVTPSYNGTTPTKTATAQYSYTFNNTWSPAIVPATADATYTAQFNETVNQYTATITANPDGYGTVSSWLVTADYWISISINWNILTIWTTTVVATPTTWNAQYTYTFSGWNNTCGNSLITGCIIQAQFDREVNEYDVIFDSNGWDYTPPIQNVEYWSTATKPIPDPTKTWYEFSGWTLNWIDFDFSTPIVWTTNLVAKRNLVEYTITYNLNWWTNSPNNPATYTIESWAITLEQPIKTWYVFLWWTWSNGEVVETWIIIPSWSYGDKEYNAVWQSSNVEYIIYHYVKKIWENKYILAETETWHWRTDDVLTLSSLSKESQYPCVSYDRWSLTWTENWPWEIVTQTTIKWDGSTKIYLYYNRNSYTVHLSGDKWVDYLEINGERKTEAVRECGSEVPVNAVPKPWYHFVRWDREERSGEEWEDDDIVPSSWHSGWSGN